MKLPSVSASFAVSIDGKIAARGGESVARLSAGEQRRKSELLADADAVLVGRGALEAGDLALRVGTRDLRTRRLRAGKTASPVIVVLSNSGRLRRGMRIFRGGAPVVVFTTRAIPAATRRWLDKIVDLRIEPRAKRVNLRRALAILARDYGVRSIFCEGGAQLFRSLVEADVVRTLQVTFVPVVIGGAGAPTLVGPAQTALLPNSLPLRLVRFRRCGAEASATYRFPVAKNRQ